MSQLCIVIEIMGKKMCGVLNVTLIYTCVCVCVCVCGDIVAPAS